MMESSERGFVLSFFPSFAGWRKEEKRIRKEVQRENVGKFKEIIEMEQQQGKEQSMHKYKLKYVVTRFWQTQQVERNK